MVHYDRLTILTPDNPDVLRPEPCAVVVRVLPLPDFDASRLGGVVVAGRTDGVYEDDNEEAKSAVDLDLEWEAGRMGRDGRACFSFCFCFCFELGWSCDRDWDWNEERVVVWVGGLGGREGCIDVEVEGTDPI